MSRLMDDAAKTVRYAGFWIRAVATLIDLVVLTAILVPLMLWIYGIEYFGPDQMMRRSTGFWEFVLSYVFPAVAAILLWKYKSATPGKMVLGIKIVDARTGGKLSTGQCVVRYFAYLVSMLPCCLGFFWIAVDPKKQAWHDKIAGTVVVW